MKDEEPDADARDGVHLDHRLFRWSERAGSGMNTWHDGSLSGCMDERGKRS
jgi:hypothetical protein